MIFSQYVQGNALHIAQYIKLKDDLFTAVLEERREDALHIYNEWKATIANARGVALHIGVDTLAEIIFSGLKDRIGPVLAEILANLQFAGSDVNIKGIIISQLLEKAGIRGALGRLIYDTINSLHIRGIPTQEDLINGFLSISYSLAQEIKILSQDKFLVTIFGWLRLNFLTLSGN